VTSASQVCCPSGEYVTLRMPGSWYRDAQYCTGIETGKACGSNEMCKSGMCINDVCKDERLPDSSECEEDADCTSGACAGESYVASASQVCCPGGEFVTLRIPGSSYRDARYCSGLDAEVACGSNDMCKSGTCEDGKCKGKRQRRVRSTNTTGGAKRRMERRNPGSRGLRH
jgi:hypothetical protein